MLKDVERLIYTLTTNEVSNKSHLAGGSWNVLQLCNRRTALCSFLASITLFALKDGPFGFFRYLFHDYLALSFLLPECPRNVRVGANSPSLCPTIFSVT